MSVITTTMTWIVSAMTEASPSPEEENWNTANALAMTPTAADLMTVARNGDQYKKNDRLSKRLW